MRKRDFLIKVNKPPRCHNPHKSLTPRRLFAAKTLFQSIFQLHSIFCLHSITVVTLSKPIHFVVMKRSRTEKSPWIKSKTKLGPNKKKIDEIHSDRGLNLAESDKGSWSINSRKARQLVLHLWMYQQSVRKNNGSKESGRKKCYERATSQNESGLFFIVGFFIVRNESPVCSCFVEVRFFSFRFVLC